MSVPELDSGVFMGRFVTMRDSGDVLEVEICSEYLDFSNASIICNQVVKILARHGYPNSVIDISHVQEMSSAGVGFLMHVKDLLVRNGSWMKLRCENHALFDFMCFLHVNPLFEILPSEALAPSAL